MYHNYSSLNIFHIFYTSIYVFIIILLQIEEFLVFQRKKKTVPIYQFVFFPHSKLKASIKR